VVIKKTNNDHCPAPQERKTTLLASLSSPADNDPPLIEENGDLTKALERSHNAVTNAMNKHRPAITLHVAPAAEEPILPAQSPILAETVDKSVDESPIVNNKGVIPLGSTGGCP
jgi:hypothetical protein